MRTSSLVVAVIGLLLASAGSARADDFDDFRIPPNRAALWTLHFDAGAFRGDRGYPGWDEGRGSVDGRIASRYYRFSDSDPATTTFSGMLAADGYRARRSLDAISSGGGILQITDDVDRTRVTREQLSATLDHRRYPGEGPFAATGALGVGGNYAQEWTSADRHRDLDDGFSTLVIDEQSRTERWVYVQRVTASLGAGLGRVRNATGVYDAIVLEARLRDAGALARPLSPAARRRLAELAYLRYGYLSVHDRPARDVWAEIERILRDDGALREAALDAYAVLRALESHGARPEFNPTGFPASPVLRLRGSFVGPFLEYQHLHLLQRFDSELSRDDVFNGVPQPHYQSSTSSRFEDHADDVLAGFGAETHRPLTVHLQLDASGRVLVPLRKEETGLRAGAEAMLDWLVVDRWTGGPRVAFDWADDDRRTGASVGDETTWVYGVSFEYYVEDRVTLFFSASERQRKIRGGGLPTGFEPDGMFIRDGSASVGISYRLSGRFSAPGYFESPRRGEP